MWIRKSSRQAPPKRRDPATVRRTSFVSRPIEPLAEEARLPHLPNQEGEIFQRPSLFQCSRPSGQMRPRTRHMRSMRALAARLHLAGKGYAGNRREPIVGASQAIQDPSLQSMPNRKGQMRQDDRERNMRAMPESVSRVYPGSRKWSGFIAWTGPGRCPNPGRMDAYGQAVPNAAYDRPEGYRRPLLRPCASQRRNRVHPQRRLHA